MNVPLQYNHIRFEPLTVYDENIMIQKSEAHFKHLNTRRSLRFFSDKTFPKDVIENLIMAASTAPSGANKQPWSFCVVSSSDIKKQIRFAAEEEEYRSYHSRMSAEWLEDLKPFGTDWQKPF